MIRAFLGGMNFLNDKNSGNFLLSLSSDLVLLHDAGQLPGQIIEVLGCLIHLLHAFLRLGRTLIDILHRLCDLIHSGQLLTGAGRNLL